ncbi:glycoside hydrolase family 65 protein [Ravibacter arvi]|uniref:Glycoside hydrolase family 65 protein n=1 Tax=Ravibacter arvi TaxID=2051041 RepID=A0ABP8LXN7_9BACT
MKNYITHAEWSVIEEGFHPAYNEITESLMSLGNGRMGQRGNFEERYSGKSLSGNYVAGVYFPDKTRVGWWKNGYPDYFAKVLNACNWIGIDIRIGDEMLDLAEVEVEEFRRELNMKEGVLYRSAVVKLRSGVRVRLTAERFNSMADDESGAIRYSITLPDTDNEVKITPYLDGTIKNRDANYGQHFWDEVAKETAFAEGYLVLETIENPYKVERFQVATGMAYDLYLDGERIDFDAIPEKREKYVAGNITVKLPSQKELVLVKYGVNLSSANHERSRLLDNAKAYIDRVRKKGYQALKAAHVLAWAEKWERNDIMIDGDVAAQQGIRFNIFHLEQTYTGKDARLNIGPKGFTGEKYGGSTYWDTEAYCIPFYLATADASVARNLLVYRHRHLGKAIDNAAKLGFGYGAALYPMVTMNGEECHNEWEITFEEIHRNGAIAYAIYDYVRYTGDTDYLGTHGLEVLIGISRFWKQRFNWSEDKKAFVMLGVTGPNEYENNVNNNWYTNYIANWTLKYTLSVVDGLQSSDALNEVFEKVRFNYETERGDWEAILAKTHFPYDPERGVFLQQDGFLDKDLLTVDQIADHRPINQNWSWDRILRSCFIKQADVLQGMYFFEEDFTDEQLRKNFDFYEPMTVHESSLSPCVHAILAARIDRPEKAYEMYVRTSRLDLDDYNNDTEDGLHITSMAGTWMSIVKGFAGQRVVGNRLVFKTFVPENWNAYSFRIAFRGTLLQVKVSKEKTNVQRLSGDPLLLEVNGATLTV